MMKRALFLILSFLVIQTATAAESFDHSIWDQLLKRHVQTVNGGKATTVDYQGMHNERELMQDYLKELSATKRQEFDGWGKEEQLAYLINTYNAWTIALILTAWPDIASIKDLGGFFISPWGKTFIPMMEDGRSLDDIEHEIIRESGRYNEPRIHFALNCASISCPALRAEAYTGERLEQQLEEQTKLFLSDRSRNRLKKDTLEVSSIFKWYDEDFEQGWLGFNSLESFFIKYATSLGLSEDDVQRLHNGKIDIDYLDYDWRLNVAK